MPHLDSILDVAEMTANYSLGDLLASANVWSRTAARFSAQIEPPMEFSLDGESARAGDLRVRMRPSAIRVVVGLD